MNTRIVKSMVMAVMLITMVLSLPWGAESQMMPMPGPGPNPGQGPGNGWDNLPIWNMMGGGSGQFRVANLDSDSTPEIVTIYANIYLVIYDNQGNIKVSKQLPNIFSPGIQERETNQRMPGGGMPWGIMGMGSNLEVADIDGDGEPEIMIIYGGGMMSYGRYLMILDSEGELENYVTLEPPQYNFSR